MSHGSTGYLADIHCGLTLRAKGKSATTDYGYYRDTAKERRIPCPAGGHSWETLLKSSGNPLDPTLEEAMAQALSPHESERFTAYLRPLVETMQEYERQRWPICGQ